MHFAHSYKRHIPASDKIALLRSPAQRTSQILRLKWFWWLLVNVVVLFLYPLVTVSFVNVVQIWTINLKNYDLMQSYVRVPTFAASWQLANNRNFRLQSTSRRGDYLVQKEEFTITLMERDCTEIYPLELNHHPQSLKWVIFNHTLSIRVLFYTS